MLNLFSKKKPKSNIQEAIKNHLANVETNPEKTYILVTYVKKDNTIVFYSRPIENNIVNINDVGYVVDDLCRYYFDYESYNEKTKKTERQRILTTIIFEGSIVAFNPFINGSDPDLSERVAKNVLDYLKQGLLEAALKRRENLKKIIMYVFIAVAALFALGKIFKFF